MKSDEKRATRLAMLFQRAIRGKYTSNGKFSTEKLILDAKQIGIVQSTAEKYANQVIERLQRGNYL